MHNIRVEEVFQSELQLYLEFKSISITRCV